MCLCVCVYEEFTFVRFVTAQNERGPNHQFDPGERAGVHRAGVHDAHHCVGARSDRAGHGHAVVLFWRRVSDRAGRHDCFHAVRTESNNL